MFKVIQMLISMTGKKSTYVLTRMRCLSHIIPADESSCSLMPEKKQ